MAGVEMLHELEIEKTSRPSFVATPSFFALAGSIAGSRTGSPSPSRRTK